MPIGYNVALATSLTSHKHSFVMKQQTSNSSDEDSQLLSDSLKHVSVMNDEGETFGLPSLIFAGGVTLTLTLAFLLPIWAGVLFAGVYFPAMYSIHKDDPKAFEGWVNAALKKRKEIWSGGTYKGRKIFIIDNKD